MADPNSCWIWTGLLHKDRPYITINGRKRLVYRWVFELVHGIELKTEELLLHSCDNPKCCNPHHLRVGTHEENMQDMKDRDRHGLPKHVVRSIRKLIDNGRKHQEIADLYGISRELVTSIANNRRHTEKDDYDDQST